MINFAKQSTKASEFPVDTQIALGFVSIIALEFIGLESSSIIFVFPRYLLVAIISVLGDGIQICNRRILTRKTRSLFGEGKFDKKFMFVFTQV